MNKTNQSTSLVRNTEGKLPSKVADDVVGTVSEGCAKCQCYNENFSMNDPCLNCANGDHDEHCQPDTTQGDDSLREQIEMMKFTCPDCSKKHQHIWKYLGDRLKQCEAPFPTIESCGKVQIKINGEWKDES